MKLGAGRAEAITDKDIATLADQLGVHPADLEAIAEVESNGFGWFADGRMKILFEKHWFYKLIDPAKRAKAVNAGLARAKWIAPKDGGYTEQKSSAQRYKILQDAIAIDEDAAYQSISMGKFQIMGFNHGLCGFVSAKQMFGQFVDSEANQLRAFANFLKGKNLIPALKARDFAEIEKVYNGGGLNGTYAKKMKAASDSLRAGKWKHYQPAKTATEVTTPNPNPVNTLPAISAPQVTGSNWLETLFNAIATLFKRTAK